ncbi:MAG TPA: winged helix-turn-helix domain-containing protein [Steroidobacteraceae bacterium]|nr:winged helix-turn-helix domain-containing protein [Steroidobacteraceae bacterium]
MHATEGQRQILIVDRDLAAVESLRQELSGVGFAVRAIADCSAAAVAIVERPPHLVIVDWNMPGFTALDLIEGIRAARAPQSVRLIILSALAGEHNVVAGLNFGADDYIAKPFSLREVVARVCSVLRSRSRAPQPTTISCGALVLDSSTSRVTVRGRSINIRGLEYRLLEFLMSNLGRTFNRNQLLTQVWGDDSDVDERTVDVNMQRLRKALREAGYEAYIQTVRGFGYRFAAPPTRILTLTPGAE